MALQWRRWLQQLFPAGRQQRRMLIAAAGTVAVSLTLLGLISLTRWHNRQALDSDTRTVITQAGSQLIRAFISRRGTLTLLRDTFRQSSGLNEAQLKALGDSAVAHTRHLLGIGLIRQGEATAWWSAPSTLSQQQQQKLLAALAGRTRTAKSWRVAATFVVAAEEQPLLVMLEPLRNSRGAAVAVIGVFELKPLLADFFTSGVLQGFPAQLLDDKTLLYRSPHWVTDTAENKRVVVEQAVSMDAARWRLQMQPGINRVTQTLSWVTVLLFVLGVIAAAGAILIIWVLAARTWLLQRAVSRRTAALRRSLQRVRQLSATDELTGLYNRRFFLRRWLWECDRAKRYQRPLTCLMVDVNQFKQVNDRLGHLSGDFVLKQVAQELKQALRQSDIIARFGGDEFVVALPETTPNQAALVAEKLRQVRIIPPDGGAKGIAAVSLSVGYSRAIEAQDQPEDLLELADQSLYASKHGATNRVSKHLKTTPET